MGAVAPKQAVAPVELGRMAEAMGRLEALEPVAQVAPLPMVAAVVGVVAIMAVVVAVVMIVNPLIRVVVAVAGQGLLSPRPPMFPIQSGGASATGR
jgi:hypothetical protein